MKFTKGLFFYLLLITLACGCKSKMPTISQKEMTSILLDMHIADSYAQILPKSDSKSIELKNKDSLKKFYSDIFQIHHIKENEFIENLEWYKMNTVMMDSMYQSILADLSLLQVKKKDSIENK